MHDCLVFALLKGVPGGAAPWSKDPAKFICAVPGYDRHFALCEAYGIEMATVPMTGAGPDMDAVEALAADPAVKGMWCVPKYSNPTGETYAPEVVRRLAAMKTGAPDFRLFWDNAYASHHLTGARPDLVNILEACAGAGQPNRPFVFASTSKMTFAGGGLALFASSPDNVAWFCDRLSKRTIGPDKMNQLRHVRFLKDQAGIDRLMDGHRALLAPKFAAVDEILTRRLDGTGAAEWTKPQGGYFVSVDVMDGCAKRVVELARDAGLALVPAGATFPHGRDPNDRNIRLAPSYPDLTEIEIAVDGVATCVLLAVSEALLARP
jgi:DNA-binding transcriptional MocR family regulator